jgi:enhancing lycopene biosynthesis protein 2
MGSPQQITTLTDGRMMFHNLYVRATTKGETFIPIAGAFIGGTDMQNQSVMVTIGNDGKAADVFSSYGANEVQMGGSEKPTLPGVQ